MPRQAGQEARRVAGEGSLAVRMPTNAEAVARPTFHVLLATHRRRADHRHVLRAKNNPSSATVGALVLSIACTESKPIGPVEGATSAPIPSGSASVRGQMNRADAIAAAEVRAKTKHDGLGLWRSALRFDSPSATFASGNWQVSFMEMEPKGKPQGLTVIITAEGGCTEAAME